MPVLVPAVILAGGGVARAASPSVSLCVASTPNTAVTSASSTGTCASGSTAVALPASSAEQQTLLSILPHITFNQSGVDGKPTVQFSGVNVQVVSGSGSTGGTVNGEGNLIVGYAENVHGYAQSGSNDLIVGTENGWSGWGEIVGGDSNQASGSGALTAGSGNQASGASSTVFGDDNTATATAADSSVAGGEDNTASGFNSSVAGGESNNATGENAAVSGGVFGNASGENTTVTGGEDKTASIEFSSAGGDDPSALDLNASNWTNAGYGAGTPEYYTDASGLVHLQGAVTQTSASSVDGSDPYLIGTLDPSSSPSRSVYTIVHTLGGTYADLVINPQGQIFMISSSNTNAGFLSLEGITFRP
jgi:hypothetical protein